VNEANGKPKIKIYMDHGVSKGECTISFVDEATAQKVIANMNGKQLGFYM
jgi:RNA recognition motif-containing protein